MISLRALTISLFLVPFPIVSAQTPDAQEPNDSGATSTNIGFGSTVATKFYQEGDVDYFSFVADAGLARMNLTGKAAAGATIIARAISSPWSNKVSFSAIAYSLRLWVYKY